MIDIQKINNNNSSSTQRDPIIYKQNDILYSFWSDNRNGNYEIYFSKGLNEFDNASKAWWYRRRQAKPLVVWPFLPNP